MDSCIDHQTTQLQVTIGKPIQVKTYLYIDIMVLNLLPGSTH